MHRLRSWGGSKWCSWAAVRVRAFGLWKALMQRYHYLGAGRLCGAQLRYLVRSERHVGVTAGWGRQNGQRRSAVLVKDVYPYPLQPQWCSYLCALPAGVQPPPCALDEQADWAHQEFGRASLGDARLEARLMDLARDFRAIRLRTKAPGGAKAAHPCRSQPQAHAGARHALGALGAQPIAGYQDLQVPRRGNRAARIARMAISPARVELRAPSRKANLRPVTLWAVWAREIDPRRTRARSNGCCSQETNTGIPAFMR